MRELTQRNGFFLPDDDAFCTVAYMQDVCNGVRYAPLYVDVKVRPCPRPPPKDLILAEVEELLAERN